MGCGVALGVRQTYKALEEKRDWMNGAGWEIPYKQPLLGNFSKSKKEAKEEIKPALLNIGKRDQTSLFLCFDNEAVEGKPTPAI